MRKLEFSGGEAEYHVVPLLTDVAELLVLVNALRLLYPDAKFKLENTTSGKTHLVIKGKDALCYEILRSKPLVDAGMKEYTLKSGRELL